MTPTSDDAGESTIAFVDIVQFTALTDIHGDLAAADAATGLETITRDLLSDGVSLVKAMGDGVLLSAVSPLDGLRLVVRLIESVHEIGLDARAGADHGPVVVRGGDVFGSTVNLTSRLAATAEPGTIAMTRVMALAAADLSLAVASLGVVELKGFQVPVEIFQADPCRHDADWLTDPVCGMRLEPDNAVGVWGASDSSGPRIGFCSVRCAEIFEREPGRFGHGST